MRIFIKLIFTISIIAGLAVPTFAAIDPEDIMGIWTFDEAEGGIAADSSGNGRDAELFGEAEWIDEGKSGSAIEFNNGYVKVEHDDAMSLETFSMVAWVKYRKLSLHINTLWAKRPGL